MHHKTSVGFMVRGDTGVDLRIINERLAGLAEGESVAWKRYSMVGGGEITVTRRGEQYEVTGATRA